MTQKIETPKAKEEATVIKSNGNGNGNGSYGKRSIKLVDMPTVELTKAAFGKLSPEALAAALVDPDDLAVNRISRERGLAMIVERIEQGRIKVTPVTIADLTYKNVVVKGVELPKAIRGVSKPKVILSTEDFDKLKPADVAVHVNTFLHKRRCANVVIPDYVRAGMPMTAVDVVSVTNGRVAVKGVVVPKAGNTPAHAITEGVTFD